MSSFDMESFLFGLTVSAVVGLFIRYHYLKKEFKGFSVLAAMPKNSEFSGYGARVVVKKDPLFGFQLSAPEDPEERQIVAFSFPPELEPFGVPRWEKLKTKDAQGRSQILMLGEVYTVCDVHGLEGRRKYLPQT